MNTIWPFLFNVSLFGSFAFFGPFIVLYYQSLGFNGTQIGLIAGLSPLITLLGAPIWTGLADSTHRHHLILSLTLLLGALVIALYPLVQTFIVFLLLSILLNFSFSPVSSLADSATMYMLADKQEMYGRVRLGGTIGFGITAAIAGGVVQNYGLKFAFWGGALLVFLTFLFSQKLVHNPTRPSDGVRSGIRRLLVKPQWLLFLAVAFSGGLGMAATNIYFLPFLKELGARETLMGFTLTLGTIAEVPALFFGNRLVKRFKPYGLFMFAMVVTGVRFLLFAVSTRPEPILFLQLFSGLTFASMWIAGVAYAYENAPLGLSASAQGLLGAMVMGFGSAVGGFSGSLLLERLGGHGMYLVFGIVILAIVAFAALARRLIPTPD